ncbi:hypothetical protein ABOM_009855 [Aspergillus bombycis]|uniref:Uncharacterized protein n=1 Tax=Aspergillus bombycis TaxID=109264 RepID=A0A1F7ZNZ4_9EURO|nr:hypothetical protein ABOM_009855 [Aspergillus bombycis]OGM41151.1 hypothetical protein ABOM_009855 [Aspergillus bombycis]
MNDDMEDEEGDDDDDDNTDSNAEDDANLSRPTTLPIALAAKKNQNAVSNLYADTPPSLKDHIEEIFGDLAPKAGLTAWETTELPDNWRHQSTTQLRVLKETAYDSSLSLVQGA